ncbi:MAG: YdcF family protein [Gammaproteobacteria bacterium]
MRCSWPPPGPGILTEAERRAGAHGQRGVGIGLDPDGSAPPMLRRRVERGAEQVSRGLSDGLLVCGGLTGGPETEAQAMARLARDAGLSDDQIILEDRSTTTWENALFARALLRDQGYEATTLVTDELHMRRALWCFRTLGMNPAPLAVSWRGGSARRFRAVLHERLGLIWYRLRWRAGEAPGLNSP